MEDVGDDHKVVKNNTSDQKNKEEDEEEEEERMLPGFRFHPTDEELVGFYLRRKVEKKPLRIELIKHIDIYKYDPWDLPKASGSVGEKEWYFFCKRGRKYRNSIRPNRVTGSGFWKATGIDKSIYNASLTHCIGLKKSLVYYRGSAGKGSKTDWMMHEFRLPPTNNPPNNHHNHLQQEAEVWTLCRIFKRVPSYKKYTPTLKDTTTTTATAVSATKKNCHTTDSSNSKTFSLEFDKYNNNTKPYLTCFRSSSDSVNYDHHHHQERKLPVTDERSHFFLGQLAAHHHQAPSSTVTGSYNYSFFNHQNVEDVLANGNWDELRSVVQFGADPSYVYDCT